MGRRGVLVLALLMVVAGGCSSGSGGQGGGPEKASTASTTAEPSPSGASPAMGSTYRTALTRWKAANGDFAPWSGAGTVVTPGGELSLDRATAVTESDPHPAGGYLGRNFYNAGTYVVGEGVSPVTPTGMGFSEVIASWNADTPPGTWIETNVRARVGEGRFTRFYNLGIWAEGSSTLQRHSVRDQRDADGSVSVDTLTLDPKLVADAFQLEFRLFSAVPGAVPSVVNASVVVSTPPGGDRIAVPGDPGRWGKSCPCPSAHSRCTPTAGRSGAAPPPRRWSWATGRATPVRASHG
ncbi:MAG TPA: hypothetical protein VM942_05435 [Acidimicrobiales bacterium]|nr:hypothetical protein [Acidimicrobiales bacterium]